MPVIINGSTGISGADGSAATPAVQGTDTNTGMFFPAADTIAFGTNGTEDMRIDASGNVGIGTSSPNFSGYGTTNLTISGGTTIQGVLELVGTRADGDQFAAGDVNFFANSNSAGNKRIVSIQALTSGATANNRGGDLIFNTKANNSSLTERARINSGGELLINTNSQPNGTYLAKQVINGASNYGTTYYSSTIPSSYTPVVFLGTGNALAGFINVSGTTTSYASASDHRLKRDVQPLSGGLATIAALKPSTYKWNADDSQGEGFIAHELAEHIPLAVTGEKDAVNEDGSIKPQGVDYSKVVVHLVAAVQELTAKLEAAEARIATLEAR